VGDGRAVQVGHEVEAPEVVGFAAQAAATVLLDAVLSIRLAPDLQQVWWIRFLTDQYSNYYEAKFKKNVMFAFVVPF
jgi:hypothetical protein